MINNLVSNFTYGNLIPWLLLGVAGAFVVHLFAQKDAQKELWMTTVAGVIGALLGGLLASLFVRVDLTNVNVTSFLFAALFSILASFIERLINRGRNNTLDEEQRYDYESGKVAYYSQIAPLSEAEKLEYRAANSRPAQTAHIVSPSDLEKYLAGISYPVSKTELVQHAEMLNANEDVLYTLDQLPEKMYLGPLSLGQHLKQIA